MRRIKQRSTFDAFPIHTFAVDTYLGLVWSNQALLITLDVKKSEVKKRDSD